MQGMSGVSMRCKRVQRKAGSSSDRYGRSREANERQCRTNRNYERISYFNDFSIELKNVEGQTYNT